MKRTGKNTGDIKAKPHRRDRELHAGDAPLHAIMESLADGIIIVDTNGVVRFVNPAATALFGRKAEDFVGQVFGFPVVASETVELDILGRGGKTAVAEMRVAETNWDGEKAYIASLRDVTDRKRMEEELKDSLERLRKSLDGTIHAMALMGEARDPYTAGHQKRVANLATAMAKEMSLPETQVDGIRLSGIIHDLGKISVPTDILSKPGRITEHEFALIKTHPQVGHDILKTIEFPWPIAQTVLQHHERMDGSGYPQGLSGKDILVEARILGVADVVEAMASHRPYRPALGIDAALEEIEKNRGTLHDEAVADACLRLFREKGYQLQ